MLPNDSTNCEWKSARELTNRLTINRNADFSKIEANSFTRVLYRSCWYCCHIWREYRLDSRCEAVAIAATLTAGSDLMIALKNCVDPSTTV